MDLGPRQVAVAGAIAAAGFLGIGALTAASAQDNGDDPTTSTTVAERPDNGGNDNGSADQPKDDGNCPHDGEARADHDGDHVAGAGHGGDHGDRGEQEAWGHDGQHDQESNAA